MLKSAHAYDSRIRQLSFFTVIDRLIFVTLSCLFYIGVQSVIVWYVAVYWDGIGQGVTSKLSRRGGGNTGVADDGEEEYAFGMPLAYVLDIALGCSLLFAYLCYLFVLVIPSINKQRRDRCTVESVHDATLKGGTSSTNFFFRIEEAPNGGIMKTTIKENTRRLSSVKELARGRSSTGERSSTTVANHQVQKS